MNKKIASLLIVAFLVIVGVIIVGVYTDPEQQNQIKVEDVAKFSTTNFTVEKSAYGSTEYNTVIFRTVKYNNHSYVLVEGFSGGLSLVHSPDCDCVKNKQNGL